MNVIILTSAGLSTGGARQALYLADGLRKLGHSVHFVCKYDSEPRVQAEALGLNCTYLPKTLKEAEPVLRALIVKDGQNVLHAFHNRGVKIAAYLGTLWRLQGLPIACAAHRGVSAKPGNPLPYLLPGIRSYMVNSFYCAKVLPLFWRRKRCYLVNNSIPTERLAVTRDAKTMRKELDIPEDHFVLGNLISHDPAKGGERLMRAYAMARPGLPPSTLVLVGAIKERLLPLCKELGLEKHCRIIERTEHVADYLQIMSLLVFASSFIESQPNVILEAMALGVPVIGSNIGGIPEILPSDCLFDPQKTHEISAKIVEMINNPERLRLLSKINSAQKDLYSMENRLYTVLSHYRAILAENSLNPAPGFIRKLLGAARV